jgi:hypothetical protein
MGNFKIYFPGPPWHDSWINTWQSLCRRYSRPTLGKETRMRDSVEGLSSPNPGMELLYTPSGPCEKWRPAKIGTGGPSGALPENQGFYWRNQGNPYFQIFNLTLSFFSKPIKIAENRGDWPTA